MNLTVGFIPYLNMVPFHQGFGPAPLQAGGLEIQFRQLSPRLLGVEAEAGQIDAGAMSLVDAMRLSDRYEPLDNFGVGVKQSSGSVLLFSKLPLNDFKGMCAVTDETSTSVRLLQLLLEKRFGRTAVTYGRVASSLLYDGSADALLLIGDEALRARQVGIKGLPVITDLATEWYTWQGSPFVFARWIVRKNVPEPVKAELSKYLEKSLNTTVLSRTELASKLSQTSSLKAEEITAYWDGFVYRLTPAHLKTIASFKALTEAGCLTA